MAGTHNRPEQAAELRRQAEEIAREKDAQSPEDLEALSPEATRQTLHELRVHQIELEMQNEELRRAQTELDAARTRYFDLYDLAPVGYCTLSEPGLIILEANLTAGTLLGVARGALVEQPISPFIFPEDQDLYYRHRKQLFETGEPQAYELRMVKKDGTAFWARLEANAAQDEDGEPVCRLMMSDVTERKQAEEALRASEERYRKLFDYAPDGILVADSEDHYIDANASMCRMLGYTHDELIGPALSVIKAKSTRSHEWQLRRKDGSVFAAEVIATKMPDGNLLAMIRDLTARKQAEEELLKVRMAVDASGEAIFMTNRDGLITFLNPEFTRLYGYTAIEVVGKSTPSILKSGVMNPEDYASYWQTLLNKQTVKGEVINKTKDGRLLAIESSGSPVLDEQGEITGFLAIQRDITERKQAEETLRQSEEQLRQSQKTEAVGQLAGGIAHDFNNLLTPIIGLSEFLLEGWGTKEAQRSDVEEIRNAAERAATLTRQLLAFSRQQPLRPQVLDLNEALTSMGALLSRVLGKDISLEVSGATDLGRVEADPGQVEQVILNLAINARDAMPDGGSLTIETSNVLLGDDYVASHLGAKPGAHVMLRITDNGCGMTDETLARIFDPFFTTKEPGKGTGLGLSTVYGIVKQSEGYIRVTSELGKGTTFEIYLPAVEGPLETAPNSSSKDMALEHAGGSETLLLVEDEPSVRELAKRVLAGQGYVVLSAGSASEAIELVEAHSGEIDLVVSDVVLPGMGGRQLVETLQTRWPAMKALYMSGYARGAIVHHGRLDPGIAFLEKPFTPQGLSAAVRSVLDCSAVDKDG